MTLVTSGTSRSGQASKSTLTMQRWEVIERYVLLAVGAALLALDEALEKFAAIDPRKAELVKLRYYVGLNFDETASALGIAVPTAKQWWAYARAWLTVEMRNATS